MLDVTGGARYVDSGARLRDVHHYEADCKSERAHDLEIDQRLSANTSDFLHVLHVGDAAYDRQENDRCDHHLDEIDERVSNRLHCLAYTGCNRAQKYSQADCDKNLKSEISAQPHANRALLDHVYEIWIVHRVILVIPAVEVRQ
jgi:hypothetical protein